MLKSYICYILYKLFYIVLSNKIVKNNTIVEGEEYINTKTIALTEDNQKYISTEFETVPNKENIKNSVKSNKEKIGKLNRLSIIMI